MDLEVLSFIHDTFTIKVTLDDTILKVKEKISNVKKDMEVDIQTLVFHGRILKNSEKLSEIKIFIKENKYPRIVCLVKLKANNKEAYSSSELKEREKKRKEKEKIDLLNQSNQQQSLDEIIRRMLGNRALPPQNRVQRYARPIPLLDSIGKKVLSEENITMLVSMGFLKKAAIRALFLNKNNVEESINYILRTGSFSDELTMTEWLNGCKHFGDFELRECVEKNICTYKVTRNSFAYQKWYFCKTCGLTESTGCCESCKNVCHKGHEVINATNSPGSFFCDCGHGKESGCVKCKCCPPIPNS